MVFKLAVKIHIFLTEAALCDGQLWLLAPDFSRSGGQC